MFFKPQVDFLDSYGSTTSSFALWYFDESQRIGIYKDPQGDGSYLDELLMLMNWDGISG